MTVDGGFFISEVNDDEYKADSRCVDVVVRGC